ncbi:MAG: hypothetical protein HQK55_08520 [Deltaproteobacteria bacterium]|nr:hypothetical protein [Deltaproteobacteria bacterium]
MQGGAKLEHSFGELTTYAEEAELTGASEVTIQAGGESPTLWPVITALITLTLAATAGCIAAAHSEKSEKKKTLADGLTAGLAGLAAIASSPAFKALNEATQGYLAKIELKKNQLAPILPATGEIEITSDDFTQVAHEKFDLKVKDYALSCDDGGNIVTTNNFGILTGNNLDIYVTKNYSTVANGDTKVSSNNTVINSTTKTSLGVAQSFLTIDATNIKSGSNQLALDGVNTASVCSSTGQMSLSAATDMNISGTGGVTITSGGTINIGAPGATVKVTDLATAAQLQADNAALVAQQQADYALLVGTIQAQRAQILALKAQVDTVANMQSPTLQLLKKQMKVLFGKND